MRTSYFHWRGHSFGVTIAALSLVCPLGATVLDNFDSTTSWTASADEGSTVSVSTSAGESGQALSAEFKLGRGKWAGISKGGQSPLNLPALGVNGIRFFYKASSLPSAVEYKLADSDFLDPGKSTKLVLKFRANPDNQWHEVIAPFLSFETWTDTGIDGEANNAVFDFSAVSNVSYGVSYDGEGLGSDTIRFDDFSFYKLDAPVPLVNSYENFVDGCWIPNECLNERPGPKSSIAFDVNQPQYGSSMIVSTQAAPGAGTHSREIRYTLNGGGFFGIAEALEVVSVLPSDEVEFFAKGVVGGEPLHVQVKSLNQAYPFPTIKTLPTPVTTGWQKYSIPFSSFTAVVQGGASLDLTKLSEIVLLFEHDGASKAGRVYVDDIRIVRPGAPSIGSVVKTWDDFSSDKGGYKEYVRDDPVKNTDLRFSFEEDDSINGPGNKVGRLDYAFLSTQGDVPYAVVERGVGINIMAEPTIRFRYKGSRANSNIELRLTDADGTLFKKTVFLASNTDGQWRTMNVPINQFSFSADGSDQLLNLNLIADIGLFLTPGATGDGVFVVDSIEMVKYDDMEKKNIGGLISSVATPDNPFSPNGDGLKDTFTVNYTLSDQARVVFKIINLQGVPVRTMDLGAQSSGGNVLTWDGHDEGGTLLANGVYFFTLEANSDFSGDQTFRQIVGVMR